jgi:hypothetical protein
MAIVVHVDQWGFELVVFYELLGDAVKDCEGLGEEEVVVEVG